MVVHGKASSTIMKLHRPKLAHTAEVVGISRLDSSISVNQDLVRIVMSPVPF